MALMAITPGLLGRWGITWLIYTIRQEAYHPLHPASGGHSFIFLRYALKMKGKNHLPNSRCPLLQSLFTRSGVMLVS